MPTYEYRCAKCGRHFELYQSFSEEPLKKHPECGGKVTKVLSPAGIVLKGAGFYKTDNREKSSRSKEKSTDTAAASDSTASTSSSSSSSGDSGSSGSCSSKPAKSPDSSSSSGSSSKGEAKSA
jgi:putative FmdB family regulatory protein